MSEWKRAHLGPDVEVDERPGSLGAVVHVGRNRELRARRRPVRPGAGGDTAGVSMGEVKKSPADRDATRCWAALDRRQGRLRAAEADTLTSPKASFSMRVAILPLRWGVESFSAKE